MSRRPDTTQYDDLNGAEVLKILHRRFYDLLHDLPELQERFTLTRVVLRLEIVLDIWGASPPTKIYHDKLELQTNATPLPDYELKEAHHELTAEMDSRNNPPDQIRDEHGLSLPRAIRGASGAIETQYVEGSEPKYPAPPEPTPAHLLPANQENPTAKQVGRRKYAAFVEQDYGSLQAGDRKGGEGPQIGGEKVATGGGGSDHAPAQPDFRAADFRQLPDDKKQHVIDDAITRGRKVDEALNDRKGRKT